MSAMRVLVTGATGVVVVPQLLASGHRVTAVARTASRSLAIGDPRSLRR